MTALWRAVPQRQRSGGRDSTLRLRTRTANGILCYTLVNPAEPDSEQEICPKLDAEVFETDFVFGAAGTSGELNYVIYWVNDSVRIVDAARPFFRSDDGWTVFEAGQQGPASFIAELDGFEYSCVALMRMSCELR